MESIVGRHKQKISSFTSALLLLLLLLSLRFVLFTGVFSLSIFEIKTKVVIFWIWDPSNVCLIRFGCLGIPKFWFVKVTCRRRNMGGMKDEAKRITIPPLFPRVHVNDTERGGLSHGKTTFLHKSPNKISDSPSPLSLSLPPPPNNPRLLNGRPEKNQSEDKKGIKYPTSSVANTHYHSNLDSLNVPSVGVSETNPQANTDLSLQFCASSKPRGDAASSKNFPFRLENQNRSVDVMKTQFNTETQKKPKNVPHVSAMTASSNDVAKVIGDKRFWKMRTYMINQQKIFAGQVFELHRLIMVQKMVAKSPNLVLQGELEMVASKVKNQNLVTEEYPEHMKPKPSISKELMSPVWPQQLLSPPGNQWLVPVISPSEGLVYKPYAGPCSPPPSAFMVPLYGQDSSLETTFRFPVSPQFSHSYFPPRTTLDHTFQSWSRTSSHMTQAIPFPVKKSQESNDSEVHGNTTSSPPEKHKFKVLPLFPTEPTHQTDEQKQPLLRAIKSIPHNPTSASESAARIFRSIQEERRDSDHMIC